jgi:hypothetical protein
MTGPPSQAFISRASKASNSQVRQRKTKALLTSVVGHMVAFLLTVDYDSDDVQRIPRGVSHEPDRQLSQLGDIDGQDC